MNSTITAIATPPGRGAIAIIRVSGPESIKAYKFLTNSKTKPVPNIIKPIWIYEGDSKLDQPMMVYFQSPKSFTGEDMLEIHCHGSVIIQNKIISLLNDIGIVPAKPGEFSERAYYNGKIDIAQAEAIMELVASENSNVAKLATRQLAGEFSKKIAEIRNDLTALASQVAADMDFSEEDIPSIGTEVISSQISAALAKLHLVQASSEILPKLREGVHVALVGLPNAGKSTLMNSLLGYERSIVTEIAGTTRDTVTESVEISGVTYHFTDTAGLNDRPDLVEKIGIQKTTDALKSADIILLLIEPGSKKKTIEYLKDNNLSEYLDDKKTITIGTKSDISTSEKISISAKTGAGIAELIKHIGKYNSVATSGNLQVLTMRQLNILSRVEQTLVSLQDNSLALTNDVISSEIQAAISDLNELTGDQATSQIIDSIFRNFCIGK